MHFKLDKGRALFIFDNGYAVSITNSFGTYSSNHMNYEVFKEMTNPTPDTPICSKDIEIAIIKNEEFCTKEIIEGCESDVLGYMSMDAFLDILCRVRSLSSDD